jgi:DNA-binding IclR family transcriptional regulator
VSRLLCVLESYGFLQQNPQTRKFTLGSSITELGWAVNQSLDSNLIRVAIPYIDKLRATLEETVVLEVASARSSIICYMAEGPGPIRIKGTIGDRHWYHAAAGAKAILAFSSPEFRDEILGEKLIPSTPNTITDRSALEEQLKQIRRQGFSFDNEERNISIRAFGCPVFDHEGKAVAGIAVAGPIQRITWDKRSTIVPLMKETAAKISAQLGYKESTVRLKRARYERPCLLKLGG